MRSAKAVMLFSLVLMGLFLVSFQKKGRQAVSSDESTPAIIDAALYPDVQTAFNAVPEKGGLVRLPPGDFEITRPLELTRENTRVEGAGAATHIINRNQDGLPALILRPPNRAASDQEGKDPQGRKKPHSWRLQVANFRISGNARSGEGLLAVGVNEISIQGLSIDHNGGHGIALADCFENPRITQCNIAYNGKAGLHLKNRSWNPIITSNHFEENQDGIQCQAIYNITMTGNNFDDQLRHAILIEDSWGGVLTGNMVENSRDTGIVLDRNCFGMTISANMIGQNYGGGIDLRGAWGCTVSSNTFSINHQRALVIGPSSGRITVNGNNFSNAFIGASMQQSHSDPASGIQLKGVSDIVISGNIFAGLKEQAIQMQGHCRRILSTSNLALDLPRNKSDGLDLKGGEEIMTELNVRN